MPHHLLSTWRTLFTALALCAATVTSLQAQWPACADVFANQVEVRASTGLPRPVVATLPAADRSEILIDTLTLREEAPILAQYTYLRECAHHALGHDVNRGPGWVWLTWQQGADCAAAGMMVRQPGYRWSDMEALERRVGELVREGTAWRYFGPPYRVIDLGHCLEIMGLLPPGSRISDWARDDSATRYIRRITAMDSVEWSTSSDSAFVDYRYAYRNTGDGAAVVSLAVDVALIPRTGGPAVGVSWSHVHRFVLPAGQEHVVRGRLPWTASAKLMPGIRPRVRARPTS